jgi:hypothetical protein
MEGFEGVVLHFIDEEFNVHRVCIAFDLSRDCHSPRLSVKAEDLAKMLVIKLNAFVRHAEICGTTTDNDAKVSKAIIDLFGESKWFPCFGHTLQLSVRDVIPSTTPALVHARLIVKKFRKSALLTSALKVSAKEDHLHRHFTHWLFHPVT